MPSNAFRVGSLVTPGRRELSFFERCTYLSERQREENSPIGFVFPEMTTRARRPYGDANVADSNLTYYATKLAPKKMLKNEAYCEMCGFVCPAFRREENGSPGSPS